ncbi:MAG: hypothetical protein WEA10_08705 [Actinomycetota bacterium]
MAPTTSVARSADAPVCSGPVAICVDRPLLSLDRAFTYDLNAELEAGVGSLVEVLFHGRKVRGWVLGPTDEVPKRILPVRVRVSPVPSFDERGLKLCRWVAARYVAPLAAVLGRCAPPRVVSEEKGWVRVEPGGLGEPLEPAVADPWAAYREGAAVREGLDARRGVFVVRPAPEDEIDIALDAVGRALRAGRRAIVLVPQADPVPATAERLLEVFGDRATLFAGGSKRLRYRRWLEIAAGRYDVVIGTRPAVFAPLADVGLVLLSRESHPAHREDRAPYYHVRDVALARAEIDAAACVLSAPAPSVESSVLGAVQVEPARRHWPPVEVVRPGPEGRAPRLTSALKTVRRAFLFSPLPGAGVAQVCRKCGHPAACAACGGVLRAQQGRVRCVVCGAEGICTSCGAREFGLRRGGAEHVEQWAARIATVPVRAADRASGMFGERAAEEGVLVGGPESVGDLGPLDLDLVAILDADLAARRPGISAIERALTTWIEAATWAAPNGRVIVQSSTPNDPAVQSVVRGSPERFHRIELERRREGGFPVGAPVFRVVGTAAAAEELRVLPSITFLATTAGEQTICLLALDPGDVPVFGDLARSLAVRGDVERVEAEPHL